MHHTPHHMKRTTADVKIPQSRELLSASDERFSASLSNALLMPDFSDRDRSLLESIRDGVYTFDSKGHTAYVNRAAIEEFDLGWRRDDLLG